ncbi:MAG: DMT family transporter [Candidatus Thermoplasmatota archaeon]|nr:DMT family transporter [Candidatus Thermoplasmatota archaeon]MBS3790834.1 DMT family transporter [Candidatus Thermoplasmatota archaeon]
MGQKTKVEAKNFLVLIVAVTMWGSTFPAIKIALGDIQPITLGLFRAIFGFIPIALFTLWRFGLKNTLRPAKNDLLILVGIALTQFYLPLVSQNVGMTLMDPETAASMSSLLQATAPIFTIFLSALFLGEYIGVKKAVGTAIALSGTVMLVTRGGVVLRGATLIGNLMLLGSAVFYAFSGLLVKKALDSYNPLSILSVSLFISVILFLPTTFILEDTTQIVEISTSSWILAIYLGLFANGIVLILWYYVLRTKELSKQILFVYLIPFFGIIFSYIFADETITIQTFIFGAVILIGITIAQYEKKKENEEF